MEEGKKGSGDAVLTPPELARRWRTKAEAVRALLGRGELRGFRIGKCHWRVTLAAVEAYERGERQPQVQPQAPPKRRRRHVAQRIEGPF